MTKFLEKDPYKTSRLLYIFEAALEYFITTAVGGVYLAKLTAYIGFSDSLTGILSSFVSLGCGFQIVSVFLFGRRSVKRTVTVLHIVSQTLFALIYFVPIFHVSTTVKTVLLIALLLSAYILHNIVNAPKINWYMSLIPDQRRGRFTANKEIVSLLGGMAFTYYTGTMLDAFEAEGNLRGGFIAGGITLVVLMILHSCTLIFSAEKPDFEKNGHSAGKEMKMLLKDRTLFKVILISVLWNVANYVTTPFMGSYQTKELMFTTTFASVIVMAGSFFRVICSKPLGKFADKFSFANMLIICFVIEIFAFGVGAFTAPSNGKVLYMIYYLLYMAGMAGINSAVINLVYDYVQSEHRTGALALQQTFSGMAGFLTTLLISPFVEYVQGHNNCLFGVSVYAQQILSLISCILIVFLLLYMFIVIRKIEKS